MLNMISENIKTKNVVITGIAGMVGSHLTDYLLKNTDWKIYGFCDKKKFNFVHLFRHDRLIKLVFDNFIILSFISSKNNYSPGCSINKGLDNERIERIFKKYYNQYSYY